MMWLALGLIVGCVTTPGTDVSVAQGAGTGDRRSTTPVAIVSSLDGRAVAQEPGHEREVLEMFQWLDAGTRIAVQPQSRVMLIFATGTRVELGPSAVVTLGGDGLSTSSGPTKSLPSLPALPTVSPIARSVHPPPGAAAIRVRGPRIERLLPSGGEMTLADRTVLEFHATGGPAGFVVEVGDPHGVVVFHAETSESQVPIPTGILMPGTRYQWTVVARNALGQSFRNAAEFTTLARSDQEARARFRNSLANTTDARSLALLAEIDRSLDLRIEAREGFLAALALSPEDAAIRAAFNRLERQRGQPR